MSTYLGYIAVWIMGGIIWAWLRERDARTGDILIGGTMAGLMVCVIASPVLMMLVVILALINGALS